MCLSQAAGLVLGFLGAQKHRDLGDGKAQCEMWESQSWFCSPWRQEGQG